MYYRLHYIIKQKEVFEFPSSFNVEQFSINRLTKDYEKLFK
jgi:hypothetical protein